jgi:hypothetical protein
VIAAVNPSQIAQEVLQGKAGVFQVTSDSLAKIIGGDRKGAATFYIELTSGLKEDLIPGVALQGATATAVYTNLYRVSENTFRSPPIVAVDRAYLPQEALGGPMPGLLRLRAQSVLQLGATGRIDIVVVNKAGVAVPDAQVTLSTESEGAVLTQPELTDVSGMATGYVTSAKPGTVMIEAEVVVEGELVKAHTRVLFLPEVVPIVTMAGGLVKVTLPADKVQYSDNRQREAVVVGVKIMIKPEGEEEFKPADFAIAKGRKPQIRFDFYPDIRLFDVAWVEEFPEWWPEEWELQIPLGIIIQLGDGSDETSLDRKTFEAIKDDPAFVVDIENDTLTWDLTKYDTSPLMLGTNRIKVLAQIEDPLLTQQWTEGVAIGEAIFFGRPLRLFPHLWPQTAYPVATPTVYIKTLKEMPDHFTGYAKRLSEDILVQVKSKDGRPLPGIRVNFIVEKGKGEILPGKVKGLVTDSNGIAAFRFGYPDQGGIQTRIKVDALFADVADAPSFTFTSILPYVKAIVTPQSTYPGSAVTIFFPQGSSPPYASIELEETDQNGNPVPAEQKRGYFIPSSGVTNQHGAARFAYIIKPDASPGETFIKITLSEFEDEFGKKVSKVFPIGVLDPLDPTRMVFIHSGQGQKVTNNVETMPLVVKVKPDFDPNTLDFAYFIIASFPIGEIPEGGTFIQHSGYPLISYNGGALVEADSSGFAIVRFRKSGPGPVFIMVTSYYAATAPSTPPDIAELPKDAFVVSNIELEILKFQLNQSGEATEKLIKADRITRAHILSSDGEFIMPSKDELFFIQATSSVDLGDILKVKLLTQDKTGEIIADLTGSFAVLENELELSKQPGVSEIRYLSKPIVATSVLTDLIPPILEGKFPSSQPLKKLPGTEINVIQCVPGGSIQTRRDEIEELTKRLIQDLGPKQVSRIPAWLFLGDSITKGTQGACVVSEYQRSAYSNMMAWHSNLFGLVLIKEPGIINRIFVLPNVIDKSRPDPTSSPGKATKDRPATLFAELTLSRKKPTSIFSVGNIGTSNLAIDGMESRDLLILGSKNRYNLDVGPFVPAYLNDFVALAGAGMEARGFYGKHSNVRGVFMAILQHTRIKGKDGDISQLGQAEELWPELIVYWAGNNDTLEAALGGLTIQAKLTPFKDFDVERHIKELFELEEERNWDPTIPELSEDTFGIGGRTKYAAEIMQKRGLLAFKDTFDKTIERLTNIKKPDGTKPDIIVSLLPRTTFIAINVELGEDAKLRKRLAEKEGVKEEEFKLPFKINFFGKDITDPLLDITLSNEKLDNFDNPKMTKDDEKEQPERFKEGAKVSFLTIFNRLKRRCEKYLFKQEPIFVREASKIIFDIGRLVLPEPVMDKMMEGLKEKIREKVAYHWDKGLKEELFKKYKFREDEVLNPGEQKMLENVIKDYNNYIRAKAIVEGKERYVVFDKIIKDFTRAAEDPTGLPIIVGESQLKIEGKPITIKATVNGGVFSLDGVHPGNFGHAYIAYKLLQFIKDQAAASKDKRFGGEKLENLEESLKDERWIEILRKSYEQDEVLKNRKILETK